MTVRKLLVLGVAADVLLLGATGLGGRLWWSKSAPASPPAVEEAAVAEPAPAPPRAPVTTTRPVALRNGDTLVGALKREGLDLRRSHGVAAALTDNGVDLRRLRTRDALEITWTEEGEPVAVHYEPSPWVGFAVVATDGGWEVRRAETTPDVRVETVTGEVTRSLFLAVEQLGESPRLVFDLVDIFASEFDFTADTRNGDRFRLLVEKRYAGEQFVDYGRVLAAQYRSDDRLLTGVGFDAEGRRPGYYDLDGRSLKKTFLKSPLEFTRITSGFTYARPHPILGGIRPHLAVDYAAPIGTPVRAVADGVVVAAGWNGGNGIQVRVRHRSGYETSYNHLSKLGGGIRRGVRVSQRQVIGAVGSTGLSTGPHLCYRVSLNGRFVNPLSEKFIPGEPLAPAERIQFVEYAQELVRRLEASAPF